MSLPVNWLGVLKWVGVAAAIVAVVGVPVYYINKRIDAAFDKGYLVGKADCEQTHASLAAMAAENAEKTIAVEAAKAQKLEEKNSTLQRNVTKLEVKLNEALKKDPIGCVVNRDATILLRSAAAGDFSSERAPVSGQLNPEVQLRPSIPSEQGRIINSGLSTGVHSSS